MAEKKYYWLKMTDQFFEDKAIKKLRKIAGGDTYTIIYLKMLLTAIKQGNKMYFEGIEDDFMEELALELDEDTDNVKVRSTKRSRHGECSKNHSGGACHRRHLFHSVNQRIWGIY